MPQICPQETKQATRTKPPWFWPFFPFIAAISALGLFYALFKQFTLLVQALSVFCVLILLVFNMPTINFSEIKLKKFLIFLGYFLLAQGLIGVATFIFSITGPLVLEAKFGFSENVIISILVFYGLSLSIWACALARTKHGLCHEVVEMLFPRFQPWLGGTTDGLIIFSTWIWFSALLALVIILGVLTIQGLMGWPSANSFRGAILFCLGLYFLRYKRERCRAQIVAFLHKGQNWKWWLFYRVVQLIIFLLLATGFGVFLAEIVPEARTIRVFFDPAWAVAWPYLLFSLAVLSLPWLGQRLHATGQPLVYGLGSTTLFVIMWLGFFKAQPYIYPYIYRSCPIELIYGILFVGLSVGCVFIMHGVFIRGDLVLSSGFRRRFWLRKGQKPAHYGHEVLMYILTILSLHFLVGWWGLVCLFGPMVFTVLYVFISYALVPFFDRSYST